MLNRWRPTSELPAERGQVVILIALLIPMILTIGSVVVSAGNWYVLKRHLQTQVDAAAIAGGPAFTGCAQDPIATNLKIAQQALGYSGDTLRAPATFNVQLEQSGEQRIVLNSTRHWTQGDATDGSTLDNTLGTPCDAKFLDVKATDDEAPLLFRWIPLFPSLKTRAKVEISKIQSTNGLRPLGVPEVDMEQVAVLFVNENGAANDPGAIRGKSFLIEDVTPPSGFEGMSLWATDPLTPVTVGLNGNENFGVIVVASRSPVSSPISLTGTISQICNQNPTQTHCYAGGTLTSGISFIHAYTLPGAGSEGAPMLGDVPLGGGCPEDLSAPYFNLTGECPIGIEAVIDFGPGNNANAPNARNHSNPALRGVCAEVSASPGGTLQFLGVTDEGWSRWGNASFTPAAESGANQVNISWSTDIAGGCNGGNVSGNWNKVAKPYVANDASGVVQYLQVENFSGGLANSRVKDSNAGLKVTVGLVPPLTDAALTDPPIPLRIGNMPNSQSLRCDGAPNNGKSGWEWAMVNGCAQYQIYDQSKHTSECQPAAVPPDCVESKPGNFSQSIVQTMWGQPTTPACADTPNNWDGVELPDPQDPRWIPLFITDEEAFGTPSDKIYPIRRFGMFYVTAAKGLGCTGDDPNPVPGNKNSIWGHFASYVTPGFGETIPSDVVCSFDEGGLCVSNLVE